MSLSELVMKAETDKNRFISDLQEIERHLVFYKFGKEKPKVGVNGNFEIFLNYDGKYLYSDEFLGIMENVGYITKDDFEL